MCRWSEKATAGYRLRGLHKTTTRGGEEGFSSSESKKKYSTRSGSRNLSAQSERKWQNLKSCLGQLPNLRLAAATTSRERYQGLAIDQLEAKGETVTIATLPTKPVIGCIPRKDGPQPLIIGQLAVRDRLASNDDRPHRGQSQNPAHNSSVQSLTGILSGTRFLTGAEKIKSGRDRKQAR